MKIFNLDFCTLRIEKGVYLHLENQKITFRGIFFFIKGYENLKNLALV